MTNLDRCLAYVRKLPAAISGSGGHNATVRAACECVRFGLTDSEALQVMTDFNLRCQPAWSEKDLAHKLADARKLAAIQVGTRGQSRTRRAGRPARQFDRAAVDRELGAIGTQRMKAAPGAPAGKGPNTDSQVSPASSVARSGPVLARAKAPFDRLEAHRRAWALVESMPGYLPGAPLADQPRPVFDAWCDQVERLIGAGTSTPMPA